MRVLLPSSRVRPSRMSLLDAACAAVVPIVALGLRDAAILTDWSDAALFWGVSFASCLVTFTAFRLHTQLPEHFAVSDAVTIAKACLAAELLTIGGLFILTRLEGVPRSTLVVQGFLLCAGLLLTRLVVQRRKARLAGKEWPTGSENEHVLLIGANKISSMYLRMLDGLVPQPAKIVAVLDDSPEMVGRSIAGVPILGPISQIAEIIHEFEIHGVRIDRVVVAEYDARLAASSLERVRAVCEAHGLRLEFAPSFLVPQVDAASTPPSAPAHNIAISRYFRYKRKVDLVGAGMLIVLLAPLCVVVGLLTLIDVGSPVLFWQRRLGYRGRSFYLLKFRTLRSPYEKTGRPSPEGARLSPIGKLLRRSRQDELPQLLNVLVGDMSLIGPRPLLPVDQPENPTIRLMVRPGISGWAQVNGGTLLSPAEKHLLDAWYIENASFMLDLRIAIMSLVAAARGGRGRQTGSGAGEDSSPAHFFRS
jgi:lipopolysaccharide/colanic/teichoic acid biosynthesis glycosyltransferase